MSGADPLRANLDEVRSRLERACARAGRDPAEVTLLAITKTVDPERLRTALALGLTRFGENRVQEAEVKETALPDARWEMVGRLQSNKAARALEIFDAIHSVDSVALAERLDRLAAARGAPYPVYLQVNVDQDEAKAGFAPDELRAAARDIAALQHLEVRGVMTVGRLVATPELARPTFRALRELGAELHSTDERIGPGLSMGMSDDFEIAVEEGASVVRLGRVLFGERLSA